MGDKFDIEYDEDILNKIGPAIQLYGSEFVDTDDNDSGSVDDNSSTQNCALELEEDQYWANHNSGESYLANTADENCPDELDNSSPL